MSMAPLSIELEKQQTQDDDFLVTHIKEEDLLAAIQVVEEQGIQTLLEKLPFQVRQTAQRHLDVIEEICMDVGKLVTFKTRDGFSLVNYVLTEEALQDFRSKFDEFRDDNRIGVDGTLHRLSAIKDRYNSIAGITIRIGRHVMGAAKALTDLSGHQVVSSTDYSLASERVVVPQVREVNDLLTGKLNVVFIGPPAVGKTTLLREATRLCGMHLGPRAIAVDKSNEIGGEGRIAHVGLGYARRMQIPYNRSHAQILMEALTNHGPKAIIADEIQGDDDVASANSTIRRGVKMIVTVHGDVLLDVKENTSLSALFGEFDISKGERYSRPLFDAAVEVRGKGKFVVYTDVGHAMDIILKYGNKAQVELEKIGLKVGKW